MYNNTSKTPPYYYKKKKYIYILYADPGRTPLSLRFMRHTPVLFVDFPAPNALRQIYSTFNRAMLKLQPNLRSYVNPLTEAMVEFYIANQNRFTPDQHRHYIYSPRELTR